MSLSEGEMYMPKNTESGYFCGHCRVDDALWYRIFFYWDAVYWNLIYSIQQQMNSINGLSGNVRKDNAWCIVLIMIIDSFNVRFLESSCEVSWQWQYLRWSLMSLNQILCNEVLKVLVLSRCHFQAFYHTSSFKSTFLLK